MVSKFREFADAPKVTRRASCLWAYIALTVSRATEQVR